MNYYVILSTFSNALALSLIALGIYISFRILKFPDLTCDGSFPLGAAITAILITSGWNPIVVMILSLLAGATAGFVSAYLNVKFKIPGVVSSIVVMTSLYSINLTLLNRATLSIYNMETMFDPLVVFIKKHNIVILKDYPTEFSVTIILTFIIAIIFIAVAYFLNSYSGLSMQIAGDGKKHAIIKGINSNFWICIGIGLANALISLGGSVYAQYQKFADINMGFGMLITGLASVFIGQAIEKFFIKKKNIYISVLFVFIGTLINRYILSIVLIMGISNDLVNLITSIIVTAALLVPSVQSGVKVIFQNKA